MNTLIFLGLLLSPLTISAEKKPELIYFHATWCPPCNQMEETVLLTPQFKEKVSHWKYSKVDGDKNEAWELKNKFKITGYPTFLFLNNKGEETLRIAGSREKSEFLRLMDLAARLKTKSSSSLCNSTKIDELWACAVSAIEKKEKSKANEVFSKLSKKLETNTPELLQLKTFLIENEETTDLKKYGYEKLMQEFPASPLALNWTLSYLDFFDFKNTKPNQELIQKVLNEVENSKKDLHFIEYGLPYSELEQLRATVLLKIGKLPEARKSFLDAKDLLEAEAKKLPANTPSKGFDIDIIYCLEMGGKVDEALQLAQANEAKYPKEFTFYFRTATLLEKKKNYNEALTHAKKAYEFGYGDNKIRAATVLVKLLAVAHNSAEAKQIKEEIEKLPKPDPKLEVRTHRHLKDFETTYQKFFPGK